MIFIRITQKNDRPIFTKLGMKMATWARNEAIRFRRLAYIYYLFIYLFIYNEIRTRRTHKQRNKNKVKEKCE